MAVNEEKFHAYEEKNAFMAYNHISICDVDLSGAIVKVDITPESRNLLGLVHGGLIFSMIDTACGLAARADTRRYVTQSAHINYLSNVEEGTIYAKAEVMKRGHRMVIVHAEVLTEDGKVLADAVVDMYCTEE